jgi:hypothetical protein
MLTKFFAALFFASVAHAWAHGDHHHHPVVKSNQIPISHFLSLEQAADKALRATQLFVDRHDAQALSLLNQYSLQNFGEPGDVLLAKQFALQSPLSVTLLEPLSGPIPQTANIHVVVYTASRPVLFRYVLYAPTRGQWQISDISVTYNLERMQALINK